MIKERFSSIRPKKQYFPNHTPYNYKEHKDTVVLPPDGNIHTALTEERAQKRGLSVEEYRKRVRIVAEASKACAFQHGDTGFPKFKKDYEKYGKMMVVGVVRHYDDWGTVEWDETAPYILTVSPLKDRNVTVNCTHGWLVKELPHAVEVEPDAC